MGAVRGRVLIVDNEEDFYRPLVRGLALEGFEVAAAGSGSGAMAFAEREPPDLVILELALPGMDGFETLRRLRERVKNIRAVVLRPGGRLDICGRPRPWGYRSSSASPLTRPGWLGSSPKRWRGETCG